MPKDHSQPINEADRQARAAFKAYVCDNLRGIVIAPPIDVSQRTCERIAAGKRDVPPGLARELATFIRGEMPIARHRDQLEGWAMALELWADDCDQRSKDRRHA